MAFADLFTRLSGVSEDGGGPGSPRNEADDGGGGARKRWGRSQRPGPPSKRQCFRSQTAGTYHGAFFEDSESNATNCQKAEGERGRRGFPREAAGGRGNPGGHRGRQNRQAYGSHKGNKHQQQQKQNKPAKKHQNQHRQRGRLNPASRTPGGGAKNKNDRQDAEVKRRFMTEEFKEQNALVVDGRILCRHFLWGKCIKGEECQLEHVRAYNDLIKDRCKFYVQGFCFKGENCPYMHKSFPCKFFHSREKCPFGDGCRFSHEPLNDVTQKLFEEAMRLEEELAKRTEQASPEPPANPDECETTTTMPTAAAERPDVPMQPVWLNFYHSAESKHQEDPLLPQTEEVANGEDGATGTHGAAARSRESPSNNLKKEEPVCYAVEAVLGPQLSKPFSSLFKPPASQDSSDGTQSEVPYSVDAVLRSCKSLGGATFGSSPTAPAAPTAPAVSETPTTDPKESSDPLPSSASQNDKVVENKAHIFQESAFGSPSSLQTHRDAFSVTGLDLASTSGDHRKQCAETPASRKPEIKVVLFNSAVTVAEKSAGDLKVEPTGHESPPHCLRKENGHLPAGDTRSGDYKTDGVRSSGSSLRDLFARPLRQTSASHKDGLPAAPATKTVNRLAANQGAGGHRPPRNARDSASLSVSRSASAHTQSGVPYSVDAVLRSRGSTPTPTAPTAHAVSDTPATDRKESSGPPLSSEVQNEKAHEFQEGTLKSSDAIPAAGWALAPTSGDQKEQCAETPGSRKPEIKAGLFNSAVTVAEKSAGDVKVEPTGHESPPRRPRKENGHLPADNTRCGGCKSDGHPSSGSALRNLFAQPLSPMSTPRHPTHLKPHLSGPGPNLPDVVPALPTTRPIRTIDHPAANQVPGVQRHSQNAQSGPKSGTQQPHSSEVMEAECKTTHCGDLTAGCKTRKRPFKSLFANLIPDPMTRRCAPTPACPQGFIRSPHASAQTADFRARDTRETAAEPDEARASSVRGLFATPLPCMQSRPHDSRSSPCSPEPRQPVNDTSRSSDATQRASNLETRTASSPEAAPAAEKGTGAGSAEDGGQPARRQVNPADSPSERQPPASRQPLPNISLGSAPPNSVLRTLFVSLRPYQQDGGQIRVPPGASERIKRDPSGTAAAAEV